MWHRHSAQTASLPTQSRVGAMGRGGGSGGREGCWAGPVTVPAAEPAWHTGSCWEHGTAPPSHQSLCGRGPVGWVPTAGAPLTPVRELLVVAVLLPAGQRVQVVAAAAVLDHVVLEARANTGLGWGQEAAMTSGVPTGACGTGPGSWESGEATPCEVVGRWPSCRGTGPLPEVLGPEDRGRAAAPNADADTWL